MHVKGLLIDLDGVLYVGGQSIKGAREAIEYITDKKYQFRFVTNTTRKCRKSISGQLSAMGLEIAEEYIFTPTRAAIACMKSSGRDHFFPLTAGDVDQDFIGSGTRAHQGNADYVIVGDAGDALTYESLNIAFRYLMNGAELIALEKDRYWMAHDGLSLSAGPFVSALEFATGKKAIVMGKPSRSFFEMALKDMELQPHDVAMIGDDIFTDIGGAQEAGMTGILVRTGKFREESLHESSVTPDAIIDSIAHLPEIV